MNKQLTHNPFDFIKLYKTAEETRASLKKYKNNENADNNSGIKSESPKRERSPNKHKKNKQSAVEVTTINIEGPGLSSTGRFNTPTTPDNTPRKDKVKSIMKSTPASKQDMDESAHDVTYKSKKRNKSVSFMLEDHEEVAIKKSKSEETLTKQPRFKVTKLKKNKKPKKDQAEKENKIDDNIQNMETMDKTKKDRKPKEKRENKKLEAETSVEEIGTSIDNNNQDKKKKNKLKKSKRYENSDNQTEPKSAPSTQNTEKIKAKKKKHESKSQTDAEEEPASKSRKKDIKPDVIVENLENLSIGDTAHTLTNLLDEMTVADKETRKKLRKKINRSKRDATKDKDIHQENSEEVKEKKWKKKRWNKDRKVNEQPCAVVIDNLPIALLFTYKKVLAEHFAKCGLLKSVGIAEVYPTEVSKPVFTTTIFFNDEEAAAKALQEDGSTLEGSKLRVSRPRPATETTAVIKTYGALSEQALTTVFTGAAVGRVRSIKIAAKGKKSMSTAFVEFDGPESLQKALKTVCNAKIGGKKIHISKFELRKKTKNEKSSENVASDADHSDDDDN